MQRFSRMIWVLGVMLLVPALGLLAAEAEKGKDVKKEGDKSSEKCHHHDGHAGKGHHGGFMAKLNLTDEQKAKLKEMRKKHEEEFVSILTPEQKKTFEEMKKAHESHEGHHKDGGKHEGKKPEGKKPEGEPKPS